MPIDPEHCVLGTDPVIDESAIVRDSRLGRYTEINDGAKFIESSLDDYSYVMERCDIMSTDIGKFANIASEVRINPGNHPVEWVSQHHFLYRCRKYGMRDEDNRQFFDWRRLQRVTVGHDTWIGHKAIVLPGITIGNGAVVGAGAVVTKDVPPYAMVAGVPAKVLRFRFPTAIRKQLDDIGWWHWEHDLLRERLADFYDIRRFLHLYGESP